MTISLPAVFSNFQGASSFFINLGLLTPVTSNMKQLNPWDINNFPVPESALGDKILRDLGATYLVNIHENSEMLVRNQKQTGITLTQSFNL